MSHSNAEKLKLARYLERLKVINGKWKPHAKQADIVKAIFKDGCKRVFIQAGRKFGKALDIETPILTTEGFKKLSEVTVGDYVYSDKGLPVKVLATTEVQHSRPCYKVTFTDKSFLIADERHEWVTLNRDGSTAIKETIDFTKKARDDGTVVNDRDRIPLTKPIHQPKTELPIDPYVLGVWLGDGTSNSGRVTSADPEIFNYFPKDQKVTVTREKYQYYVVNILPQLRQLNLRLNKHIPDIYLNASIEDRINLLKGLMDTDGSVGKKGRRCCFYNSSPNLIRDFKKLITSLGIAYIENSYKRARASKEYKVSLKTSFQVFNLQRKVERLEPKLGMVNRSDKKVASVVKVDSVPVRCIQVEGGVFLAGERLTVTHNSELCQYICWRKACEKDAASVYIIGPTRKQQTEIMWANGRLPSFASELGTESFESQARIKFPWQSFIKLDGSENYEDYRGTEYDVMIFDEFKDCDFRFYEAVYPNLLARNGLLVVIGTPPDTFSHYMKLREEIEADDDWLFFHGTSWDNPYLPGGHAWLTKEKKKYYDRGDGAIWEREYEAKFVPGGANAVFPMFNRNRHVRDYDVVSTQILRDHRKLQWYVVCDPGTTTVFAVLFVAYNPFTSQVFVLDEIYESDRQKTSTVQIWNRVRERKAFLAPSIHPEDWNHIYDEAAAWFQSEVTAHFREALTPTTKKTAIKESQVSLIKDALCRKDGILVSSSCENFILETENYVTDESGRYRDKNDHLIDCFRYFMDAAGYTFDVDAEYEILTDFPRVFTPERDMKEMNRRLNPFDDLIDEMDDEWIM